MPAGLAPQRSHSSASEEARLGSGPGLVSHGSRAQPSAVSTRWSPAPRGQKAASPVAPLSGCFHLRFSGLCKSNPAPA